MLPPGTEAGSSGSDRIALVPARIPIHGFLYDVRTGRLEAAGQARELEKES